MSTWTNVPYSYMPGTNRLLAPENFATGSDSQPNEEYVFQASNELAPDATEYGAGDSYYVLTTVGTNGQPPTYPPTVPDLVGTPTASTITVGMNVSAVLGRPAPYFYFLYGTDPDQLNTVLNATVVLPELYQATATGLMPNTVYYFASVAANGILPNAKSDVSVGYTTANGPPPPPPGPLTNFLTIDFLIKDAGTGIWQINTSGNAAYGTLFLTGAQAGTIVSGTGSGVPSQATSITNLLSYRGTNTKLIVSMGGATGQLNIMIPTFQAATDLVNTIWNVLFGASAPNVLNWSNAAWGGGSTPLFFDGLDLDWENAAPNKEAVEGFMAQWYTCQQAYLATVGKKYLNIAPQSPNSWLNAPSSSPWTSNLLSIPFSNSQAVLSSINPSFLAGTALLSPNQFTGLRSVDYIFCQIYNQPGLYLTVPPAYTTYNPDFTNQMAQWAYLVMKAREKGSNVQLIWSCASTDAPEIWTDAQRAILNSAIELINPLVSNQLIADGGAPCNASEWSGGFGLWNSPTAQALITNVFAADSPITTSNMSGNAVILYANQTYPAPDPAWTTPPIPFVDNRTPS